MRILTQDQRAAIEASYQNALALVTLDPFFFCTGDRAVMYGGDLYEPRGLAIETLRIDNPQRATMAVTINDLDGELRRQWYTDRANGGQGWSGSSVRVVLVLDDEMVYDIPWRCRACRAPRTGIMRVELLGISTLKPRAGLITGERVMFPYGPEPGFQIKYSGGSVTIPEGADWPQFGGGGTGGGGGSSGGGGGNTPGMPDPGGNANPTT